MSDLKVAIIGFAGTAEFAPWGDPTWEVWGLNGGHLLRPRLFSVEGKFRADRWFQIHPPEGCDEKELDWLARLDGGEYSIPTYVRAESLAEWSTRYPSAAARGLLVPFPVDTVSGYLKAGWLVNTFCLEVALALSLGVKELGLFGVECGSYGREIAVERVGVAYWLGIAMAHGVVLHQTHGTLFPYTEVYGLDYAAEARVAAAITGALLPKHSSLNSVNLDTVEATERALQEMSLG